MEMAISSFTGLMQSIEEYKQVSPYGKYLDELHDVVLEAINSADNPRDQFMAIMNLELELVEIQPYLDSLLVNHRTTTRTVDIGRALSEAHTYIPSIIDDDIL